MKKIIFTAIILLILPGWAISQNAPVTTVNSIINPLIGEVITIPVCIKDFSDIGTISLTLEYDPDVIQFITSIPNPEMSSILVDGSALPGRIIASWYSMAGTSLADGVSLFDLVFKFMGGSTGLTWITSDGACEYSKFNGGSYTVLNDSPKSAFYKNGCVTNQPAPETMAPILTGAVAGSLGIPIMVNRFNDVGTISLTLEYDPAALTYLDSFAGNAAITAAGSWLVGSQDAPGGKKYLRISWIKTETVPPVPVNLPDSSILITLTFNFAGPMNSSELIWTDDGESCEYSDGNYSTLFDEPAGPFYTNGIVTWNIPGPVTVAPGLGAFPNMDIIVPVQVNGFTSIESFNLRLDYDPAAMTFISAGIPNLPVSWILNVSVPVAGQLLITGSGVPSTLGNNSTLLELKFHFQGGTSLLQWFDADLTSCQFTNSITGAPLLDHPQELHYLNGSVITCICP